ncbi:hypothetical protein N825_34070 [Skermanella stibiiresistens SB22]|uniref:Glycosyl transferase family 28 C-terminal domain-containing protein n=1 Tax=Skermanella stibiiresistens SB22 TaxID=1385369 RepID=W9GT35_9PROT|nr:hypothetical protein [Skermanella stibiiresistens]EWY35841.1 hypothetical protein N825_34070 [Skermanella stibiiresistens SB22]
MSTYDVVILADLRFPGGTSTAILEEIRASAAAGYRTALIPFKGPVLRYPHPVHPELAAAVDQGLADFVDPLSDIHCGLILVHHPQLITHAPMAPLRVRAEQRLVVVHHPPFDGDGQPFYDHRVIAATTAEVLGGETEWAPVGPAVRRQFLRVADGPVLTPEDWFNILNPDPWSTRRTSFADPQRCVIGRHSRPDPLKWPATRDAVLEVYPDDPRFAVRVLGGGPFLDELVGRPLPAGWEVSPFAYGVAPAFLRNVDFYLYYHHPRWVEAFGRVILEAMAAGCVVVLPPGFEALFGEGACYAEPAEAAALALALHGDPDASQARSLAGAAVARERFGPGCHQARLRERLGAPCRRLVRGAALADRGWGRRGPRRVLLMTSNGIGLGHLTRMLAIARRLPPDVEPVFATMSQAIRLVRREGFMVEHLSFHDHSRVDISRWNRFLAQELAELLNFYCPQVLVFDGNMPHQGLLDALHRHPGMIPIWMRRAMWRQGSGTEAIGRESAFEAVLEPGELAAVVDRGPTTLSVARTRFLAPVRLCNPAEAETRAAARAALDLPAEGTCVLVQLGSGNNFDYRAAWHRLQTVAKDHSGVTLVAVRSPIAEQPLPVGPEVRQPSVYPIARYLNAFDLAVSAAGYNMFHELVLGRVPTLFVPNEHPMMDDQGARARWAVRRGMALHAHAGDPYGLGRRFAELLVPENRATLARAMSILGPVNGADQAAGIITEMAYMLRADRPET